RERAQVAEAAVLEHDARAEAREPPCRARERLGIAIDAEQARVAAGALEQLLRVAAHADRAVHHPAAATGTQEEGHLVTQDRDVGVFGFCTYARFVFGLLHPCCVFGLAPAYTGSFSFDCARLRSRGVATGSFSFKCARLAFGRSSQ